MLCLKHIKYKINIRELHHRHHKPHHHHHHPDLRGEAGLASLDLSSHQIANKLLGMCLSSMLPNIFNNTTTRTPPLPLSKKKANPNNSLLLPVPSLPLRDKWPSLGENFAMSGQKYFHIFCDISCVCFTLPSPNTLTLTLMCWYLIGLPQWNLRSPGRATCPAPSPATTSSSANKIKTGLCIHTSHINKAPTQQLFARIVWIKSESTRVCLSNIRVPTRPISRNQSIFIPLKPI